MTKPKRYTLSKREAKLGTSIPFRTEFHGDDPVTASDVPVSGIMLTQAELNDILQEPLASRALFVRRAGSTLDDPLIRGIQALKLIDKIDNASVVVLVGLEQTEVDLGNCKLKGITLEPKTGGLTEMGFKIQTTPTLDKRIATLLEHMDAGVMVEIGYEHNAEQQQLPMGAAVVAAAAEKNDKDEPKEEAEPNGNGSTLGDIGPKTRAEIAKAKARQDKRRAKNGAPAGAH